MTILFSFPAYSIIILSLRTVVIPKVLVLSFILELNFCFIILFIISHFYQGIFCSVLTSPQEQEDVPFRFLSEIRCYRFSIDSIHSFLQFCVSKSIFLQMWDYKEISLTFKYFNILIYVAFRLFFRFHVKFLNTYLLDTLLQEFF